MKRAMTVPLHSGENITGEFPAYRTGRHRIPYINK